MNALFEKPLRPVLLGVRLTLARMVHFVVATCVALAAFPRTGIASPPVIRPTTSLHSQAVYQDKKISFKVIADGTAPFSFQWRLDGHDQPAQTNQTLAIAAAQPADEGDYTVVVSNNEGAVSSEPFRLFVVPPATNFIKGNFTNTLGARLPYFYYLPANYNAERRYPLICNIHGAGWYESVLPNGFWEWPEALVFASHRQQAIDPAIVVWPTHTAQTGSGGWSTTELRAIAELLDRLTVQFNVDTNRVYVSGASAGGGPAWDVIGLRPGLVAGAVLWSGFAGTTPASAIRHVPLWGFQATDEGTETDFLIARLRAAGGSSIYTKYGTGGHEGAIRAGMSCPAMVDWLLAQRRGQTTLPSVSINGPIAEPVRKTGATLIDLAGSAEWVRRDVARVNWENTANRSKGVASGTNLWSATAIPLVGDRTNMIVVTATLNTTWAPAYGGTTTFNDTLAVISSPVRASLTLNGAEASLNWTGGVPPFDIQRATEIGAGTWTELLKNAVPPITVPAQRNAEFYRVVGQ